MIKFQTIYDLLMRYTSPPWNRLNAWVYQELTTVLLTQIKAKPKTDEKTIRLTHELFSLLLEQAQKCLQDIKTCHEQADIFLNHYTQSPLRREKEKHVLDFAALLGQSTRGLNADKRAFQRAFGKDAIMERYTQKVCQIEQKLSVIVDLIGQVIQRKKDKEELASLSQTLLKNNSNHGFFQKVCFYEGDTRVNVAAFKALSKILQHCQNHTVPFKLPADLQQAIYRYAADSNQPTWCQIDALTLLAHNTPSEFITIARKNLALAASGDQLFVRARTTRLLCDLAHQHPEAKILLMAFLADPNPYVRQQLAAHLAHAPPKAIQHLLPTLIHEDSCPQVRARAALTIPDLIKLGHWHKAVGAVLLEQLKTETDEFALRTYLHCLPAIHYQLKALKKSAVTENGKCRRYPATAQPETDWYHDCQAVLQEQLSENKGLKITHEHVHQWCAQAQTHLWTQQYYQEIYEHLKKQIANAPRALKQHIPLPYDIPAQHVARILTAVCTDEFGVDIITIGKRHLTIIKDHKRGFRLWRWWYAFRTPSTNKRQNYPHTYGRHFYGHHYIASDRIAELSPTHVPGEPLYLPEAGGYRPFLPLLEQILSSLDQGWPTKPIALYSVWGITEILPPAGLTKRIWAKWQLSRHFAQIAKLRNWRIDCDFSPNSFTQALEQLGFSIKHLAFTDSVTPTETETKNRPLTSNGTSWIPHKFFSFAPFLDPDIRYRFTDYFFSVYQNTLLHLAYFLAAMSGFFLWQHIRWNRAIKKARGKIPLVIGGWGTRGKSGSERLKAALFNALGFSVFSKTTGCEAMFLHATAHGALRELFLFRPYDKASIWEQGHVVKLASQLNCQVFLWECMGLTPRYVHILQHQWMHDDLSTITNCYPDHEDIQGPAGVDVTEVMMKFVPKNSELITSEETMSPFLAQAAREQNSGFSTINWLAAGLLTPDILARFPYAEHPYNIALILRLGQKLNLPEDFCLKEMADRVVPDLGVLKIYPTATVGLKRITFINGMSANERLATLSNWSRMGLDKVKPKIQPEVWLTTIINNRADRVARSQVFAEIIVETLSADRHYLIGDNQTGFLQYLRTAWRTHHADWHSLTDAPSTQERIKRFTQIAEHYRIPTDLDTIKQRATVALIALGANEENLTTLQSALNTHKEISEQMIQDTIPTATQINAQEITDFLTLLQSQHSDYLQIIELFEHEANDHKVTQTLDKIVWSWLEQRIKPVQDYHISGAQLTEVILKDTPPGFENRCMGIQNIKGTGLDFVYCWQQWHTHHQLCETIMHGSPLAAREAIEKLAESPNFSVLDRAKITDTIDKTKTRSFAQTESIQAELARIEKRLAVVNSDKKAHALRFSWLTTLILGIEAFLDAGDAIKRRRQADRIYEDLSNTRISHQRAAHELKLLTQKQKGGWLLTAVIERWPFLRTAKTGH